MISPPPPPLSSLRVDIDLQQKVEKFIAVSVWKIYRNRRIRTSHIEQYETLNFTCSYPEEA